MREDTRTRIYRRKNIDRAFADGIIIADVCNAGRARRDFPGVKLCFRFNRNAMHAFV